MHVGGVGAQFSPERAQYGVSHGTDPGYTAAWPADRPTREPRPQVLRSFGSGGPNRTMDALMRLPLRGGVCNPFPEAELGPAALTNGRRRGEAVPGSVLAFRRTGSLCLGLLGALSRCVRSWITRLERPRGEVLMPRGQGERPS